MTIHVLMTFICGAAYEAGCVWWVHHSEAGNKLSASAWSCFNALVTIIGVEGFLSSRWCAGAYVLGYGVGTFVAMSFKRKPNLQIDYSGD